MRLLNLELFLGVATSAVAVGADITVIHTRSTNGSRFNCTDLRVPPPTTNVSQLHPGHVGYVLAMGDSISAGFAARGTPFEDRDISWSIGVGSAEQLTLPFMLSQYGSRPVRGQSTERRIPAKVWKLPDGDYHPRTDFLNVAESSGAVHRGSMVQQWEYIQEQVADTGKYPGFDEAWKVLTVWMTANDVCGAGDSCKHAIDSKDLEKWVNGTDALLRNVSMAFRNVYVNLISTLDLSNIHRLQQQKPYCKALHTLIDECGCIDRGNQTELANLDMNVHTMNNALHGLAAKWHAELTNPTTGRADMAVVVQAFQEGIGPTLDGSFLNRMDCFHPSTIAHEDLAIGKPPMPNTARSAHSHAHCSHGAVLGIGALRRRRPPLPVPLSRCLTCPLSRDVGARRSVELDALCGWPPAALWAAFHAVHGHDVPHSRFDLLHRTRRHS
jgi:phospholipase B1